MFDLKDNLGLAQCFKAFPVAMVIDVLIRKKGEVASTSPKKRPRTDTNCHKAIPFSSLIFFYYYLGIFLIT